MVTHHPADGCSEKGTDAEEHEETYVLRIAELRYTVSPQEGTETTRWICHTPLVCTPSENEAEGTSPLGRKFL